MLSFHSLRKGIEGNSTGLRGKGKIRENKEKLERFSYQFSEKLRLYTHSYLYIDLVT